jgi:hypothetical protein
MRLIITGLLMLMMGMPYSTVFAKDDRALRAERHEAQKQRQQQRNERNRKNSDALAEFRDYVRDLKPQYQQKARDMDTEYRLRKVDLKAQRNIKIAEAEAEMHQNTNQLFLNPQAMDNKEAMEKLKADMQAHADKVFAIKKQAAEDEHNEYIDNENKKHKAFSERDQMAMDKARSLGLMTKHQPILATPIGGALTRQEEQWNKREQAEVERLYKSNQRQLAEYTNGAKLREWEINNKREDFKLKWDKESELHALKNEQNFYGIIMNTSGGDMQARQQEMSKNLAELSKRTRIINIKHKNIRDQNRIKRNKQRREIMGY